MKQKYSHKRDQIDDLMEALGRVHRTEGVVAARAMLPAGLLPAITQMMTIENIGFTRAAEVVIRTAQLVQEAT